MTLKVSKAGRRYGAKKDSPDSRDRIHPLALRSSVAAPLPPNWDMEGCLPRVRDQYDLGACTGFAGFAMRGFLFRSQNVYEQETITVPADTIDLSPLFLYYKLREHESHLADGDCGAEMRSIPWVLNHVGICLENTDWYNPYAFEQPPTSQQIAEALLFRCGAYHRIVGGVPVMKSVLASGYAFVLGFSVFESFESGDWDSKTGVMPVPDQDNEQLLGGHAVCAYGYDDDLHGGCLKIRNSWGREWGQSGNFYMPYAVANSDMVDDCWIAHLGRAW